MKAVRLRVLKKKSKISILTKDDKNIQQQAAIIAKILYRPKRFEILRTAKKALHGTNIYVKEDLCPADFAKKRLLHAVMENAWKEGNKQPVG